MAGWLNKPLAAFPPCVRLKEHQTKHTSLIPTERLQEISWQDFWRSHAPRGASPPPGPLDLPVTGKKTTRDLTLQSFDHAHELAGRA